LGVVFLLLRGRTPNAVYFSDPWHWIQPLAISAAILLLFFWEALRFRWLPTVLGALLIFSNAAINPVMSGLGPLLGSNAFKAFERMIPTENGLSTTLVISRNWLRRPVHQSSMAL